MKSYATGLLTLIFLLGFSNACLAHRVNLFAYPDGNAIQVECYFTKNRKVRNGTLVFTDIETGALLLEGTTDEQGMFRFQPQSDFLATGHGLNILLKAGEGHQNNWTVSPDELKTLSPGELSSAPVVTKQTDTIPAPQSTAESAQDATMYLPSSSQKPAALPPQNVVDLEVLIGRIMDKKLAPIKQILARQEERAPGVRDIVGGIGWIVGLLGIAMYIKSKQ